MKLNIKIIISPRCGIRSLGYVFSCSGRLFHYSCKSLIKRRIRSELSSDTSEEDLSELKKNKSEGNPSEGVGTLSEDRVPTTPPHGDQQLVEPLRLYHSPSDNVYAGQIFPPAGEHLPRYISELRGGAGGALADQIKARLNIAGPNPGQAPAQGNILPVEPAAPANNLYVETLAEVVSDVLGPV